MAAGYTLKELMEYMGHADLQMVKRYVKLLPQPDEHDPAERLNAYLPPTAPATARIQARNERQIGHAVGHKCRTEAVRSGSLRSVDAALRIRANCLQRRGKRATLRGCRRRDSNPRHADYDSAALTD